MTIAGILGGMGPQATVHFYKLCIMLSAQAFGARRNEDYPHLLISSLPVPDFISQRDREQVAVQRVQQEAKRLVRAGADFLAITCNTMHLHHHRILQAAGVPVLSIVDAVIDTVEVAGLHRVGLLGTPTTMNTSLYHEPFKHRGIDVHIPSPFQQQRLAQMIVHTIEGVLDEDTTRDFNAVVGALVDQGIQGLVLACTELALLSHLISISTCPVYDSLDLLAKRVCQEIYAPHASS